MCSSEIIYKITYGCPFGRVSSDMENRRLARYDCAKMNLAQTIKVYSIEKKIERVKNSWYN